MAPLSDTRAPVIPAPRRGGDASADFRIAAHKTSVAVVREAAREELRQWGLASEWCDDVVLVISELVTNAIVHTDSGVVSCRLRGGPQIRVEVGSEGRSLSRSDACSPSGFRPPDEAGPPDEGGRGLLVVEALSTAWGLEVAATGAGWTVWAMVTDPGPAPVREPAPAPGSATATTHGEDPR